MPSRSPCTSPRPTSACPSTTSPWRSAGRADDPRGALARRQPRRPRRHPARRHHCAEGRRPGRPLGALRDPAVGSGRAAALPQRDRDRPGAAGRRGLAGAGPRARAGRRAGPRRPLGPAHAGRRRRRGHRGRRHARALRRPHADPPAPPSARAGLRARAVAGAGPGRRAARPRSDRRPAREAAARGRRGGRPLGAPAVKPVNRRDLVVLAIGLTVAAWLLVRAFYGSLPPFDWWLPVPLALLAVAEALGARTLKARLAAEREARKSPGRGTAAARTTGPVRPVEPMMVARLAVLAQASAYVGAVFAGVWAGVLLYTAPHIARLGAASGDTVAAVFGVLSSAALVVAALWLESVCRVPPGSEDPDHPGGARA